MCFITQEKKANQQLYLNKRFFGDVIYLFCCQGHLKHFLENYGFYRKSGNDAYSTGCRVWGVGGSGVGGHVIYVIMMHYVQNLMCELPLIY